MIALPEVLVDGERVKVVGHLHALVASRSCPGEHHIVSHEFNDANGKEEWICTCRGFECRHDCRHVRAIGRWIAGAATVTVEPE